MSTVTVINHKGHKMVYKNVQITVDGDGNVTATKSNSTNEDLINIVATILWNNLKGNRPASQIEATVTLRKSMEACELACELAPADCVEYSSMSEMVVPRLAWCHDWALENLTKINQLIYHPEDNGESNA